MQATNTYGTIILPYILNKGLLIYFILLNNYLNISENTNTYPFIPINVLCDKYKYSSYHI